MKKATTPPKNVSGFIAHFPFATRHSRIWNLAMHRYEFFFNSMEVPSARLRASETKSVFELIKLQKPNAPRKRAENLIFQSMHG